MEHNQPRPSATTAGSFEDDAEWQYFADKARAIYSLFVAEVKKPIEQKVPDVKFSVDDADMALHLDLKHFNIMVYGVLKSGKSMLLKALIDPQLPVPSDASPCTSALCTIKYGARKRVIFILRGKKERFEVDLESKFQGRSGKTQHEEIMEFMHNQMTQSVTNREEQSRWESVEIYWPSEILQRGYTFVDAPGLGENEVNDALVRKALTEAHLLLVVLGSPVSQEIKEQLARLHGHKDMFFVATKFDTVKEQPWVTTNKEAVRKEVQERYILSMKTALGEALPDFKGKFNNHNFHAVSAQEIVAGGKEREWLLRFHELKKNIYSDVRVRAANAALRRLEKLIDDALEWGNGGKDNIKRQKKDQKTEHKTISQQLKDIREEHDRVRAAFVKLSYSAKCEIKSFLTSLLDETGRKNNFGDEATRLIKEFHESRRSKPWDNSAEQRKSYQENLKAVVPQQFENYVQKSQHVHIQDICVKHIQECKQIMAKLIQMLKDLDKSMEEIMPVQSGSALPTLPNLDLALPDAPSLAGPIAMAVLGTTVPSAFVGGVAGYVGLMAMGTATLIFALPVGAFFAYSLYNRYYEEKSYDKATDQMRKKMEQVLNSFIVENSKHWVESYCKAGISIMEDVIAPANVRIRAEIETREKNAKNVMERIRQLNAQEKVLDHVYPTILALKSQVEGLKEDNPFEKKEQKK